MVELPAGARSRPPARRGEAVKMSDMNEKQHRAVVLVEGISDLCALETLAERRGRDLEAEGVSIVPIGGAQAIGKFLNRFGPQGLDVRVAGLYYAAEEGAARR